MKEGYFGFQIVGTQSIVLVRKDSSRKDRVQGTSYPYSGRRKNEQPTGEARLINLEAIPQHEPTSSSKPPPSADFPTFLREPPDEEQVFKHEVLCRTVHL